ncbi:MAG: peptidyl-prolyl cis-trans isomerase [Vicinamibacteria bacterium]
MKRLRLGSVFFVGALSASVLLHGDVIERVMARVNGQIVTLSEFEARQLAAIQAARVPDSEVEAFLRQNNAKLLDEAMEELLLVDRAAALGLKLRPEYLDQVIDDIKKEQNIASEEEFQAQLKREGLSKEALRRNIERSVIVRQVRSREVDPKAQVSEADVRDEYERRKATDFTRKATVHLMEIVLKGDGAAEKANAVEARLKSGEDFEIVAREQSMSASKAVGGDLGRVEPADLNPALAAAIAPLRSGEISAPIQVEGGYWILRVRERLADEVTGFDQVKERIQEELAKTRFEKVYGDYIAELKKNAVYTVYVREAPTQIGRNKVKVAPVPVNADEEIVTTGSAAPERVTAPAIPARPSPTPTPRPR